jgi:hypothetical protein
MPSFTNFFYRKRSRDYRCDRAQYAEQREKIQTAFKDALTESRNKFLEKAEQFFAGFTAESVLTTGERLLSHGLTGIYYDISVGIPSDVSLRTCENYSNAQRIVTRATGGSWVLEQSKYPGTFLLRVKEEILPLETCPGNELAITWNNIPQKLWITETEAKKRGII